MSYSSFHLIRTTAARASVLLIGLVIPLVFSIRLEDGFELTQIFCVLIAASFLLLMSRGSDWVIGFKSNGFIYFLGLAFTGCGIYSFIGLTHSASFYFSTQNYLWVLTALLFLIPTGLFLEKRNFYAFLVLAGVLGSIYAFAQVFGLDLSGWETHFGGRSFSTLGNPIFWAGHLLVLLPLAVYLALSSREKRERLFWFGAIVILSISLLVTQTRGAWLGFLGEAVVLATLNRRKSQAWKWLMMGIIVFLLTLLMMPSLKERAISIAQIHNQDAQGRYFLWEVAWKQWDEKKWFGQGPGGYANHFQQIQSELSQTGYIHPYWMAFHAHEEFLELLAERGLVGFILGGLLLWVLVKRRLRSIRLTEVAASQNAPIDAAPRNDSNPIISAGSAEIAILIGIGIHSLFNFPFSVVPTACVLALLFNPSWDQKSQPSPKPGGLISGFGLALGIVLLVICGFALRVVAQNARLHQAIDQINGQQYGEALKTLDFDPAIGFFHYLDPRFLKERAIAFDSIGKTEEAIPLWQQVIQAYPYDADAYATLCMLYGKKRKWKESQAAGEKALDIAPGHEQALNNLATASYLRKKKKEAIRYLSRLEVVETALGKTQKASEIHQKISALKRSKG